MLRRAASSSLLVPRGRGLAPAAPSMRRSPAISSSAHRAVEGGEGGLADLLQRDRKSVGDLDRAVAAFGADDAEPAPAPTTAPAAPKTAAALRPRADRQRSAAAAADGAPKKRRQGGRRADRGAASESPAPESPSGPRRSKEAIDAGLAAFAAGDPDAAIALFNLALELPGNGAFRLPGRAREYSCPSDSEERAALYNLACCYAAKGGKDLLDAAAACLEAACDDAGFDDWDTMLSDPDLKPLGEARLRAIADARRGAGAAVRGLLGALPVLGGGGGGGGGDGEGKPAEVKVSDLRGKPWIMW